MNKYLEQLVELSSFDKQISDFIPKINEIKGVLSEKFQRSKLKFHKQTQRLMN